MGLGNFIRNTADRIRSSINDFRTTVKTNPSSVSEPVKHDAVTNTGRFNIRESLRNLGNTVKFGFTSRAGKSNVLWSNQIVKAPTPLTNFQAGSKGKFLFTVELRGAGSGERHIFRLNLSPEQARIFVDNPEHYVNDIAKFHEKYLEPYFEVESFYQ